MCVYIFQESRLPLQSPSSYLNPRETKFKFSIMLGLFQHKYMAMDSRSYIHIQTSTTDSSSVARSRNSAVV